MTASGLHTTPDTAEFHTGDSTGYVVEVNRWEGDGEIEVSVHGGGEGTAWITPGDARRMAHALTEAADRAEKATHREDHS